MLARLLRPTPILVVLALAEAAALLAVLGVQRWRAAGVSAVERGRLVADHQGCHACHGPGGTQGIANPGSDETEVPAWSGGTAMMYVQSEDDIRGWILEGKPRGHDHEAHEHGEHGEHGEDHEEHAHATAPTDRTEEAHEAPLLTMPAYKGRLTDAELSDLVAYYKAVAWYPLPEDDQVRGGLEVASEHGCFGCHGPGGKGSVSNPGSFKGYVPGWDGADFRELVKNDDELREWIFDGVSKRFANNPAAKTFLGRAPLQMPKYRGVLTDEQIDQIGAYIKSLQTP